jgi:hypothetical protein
LLLPVLLLVLLLLLVLPLLLPLLLLMLPLLLLVTVPVVCLLEEQVCLLYIICCPRPHDVVLQEVTQPIHQDATVFLILVIASAELAILRQSKQLT